MLWNEDLIYSDKEKGSSKKINTKLLILGKKAIIESLSVMDSSIDLTKPTAGSNKDNGFKFNMSDMEVII